MLGSGEVLHLDELRGATGVARMCAGYPGVTPILGYAEGLTSCADVSRDGVEDWPSLDRGLQLNATSIEFQLLFPMYRGELPPAVMVFVWAQDTEAYGYPELGSWAFVPLVDGEHADVVIAIDSDEDDLPGGVFVYPWQTP